MALFHKNYRETPARRVFKVFNYIFCTLIACLCLFPMLHILALSFSRSEFVNTNQVVLWPKGFNTFAYRDLLQNAQFFTSMWISVKRVALGLVVNMSLILLCAYPLSLNRERFGARQFYVWFFVITMLFGGGLIPTYLVVSRTGLLNSLWALVLPGAVQVMNVVLMQNFIKSLPYDISEAAFVDGAGHWRTMCQIILPLCKPSIAAISLFVMVGHWNEWFAGIIYMNNSKLYPLQSFLQTQITDFSQAEISQAVLEAQAERAAQASNRAAQMFLAMIPILCVYPFLQKHFTKGIVMGSVKG